MAVGYLTEQNINIARGLVRGASVIHKFGRNPNVGGIPETIWEQGGVYTYLTVASTVYVSGADAQDGAAGTGARTVTVQGLDANYNAIEETLTVDGAVSTQSFLRVFRAFVASAGSLQTNKGDVLVSTGASGGWYSIGKNCNNWNRYSIWSRTNKFGTLYNTCWQNRLFNKLECRSR
jgi:hypothetical protein